MKSKRKNRGSRNAPLLNIGSTKDTVAVLKTLDAALQQALLMGRDVPAVEIAKQIGDLGGVRNVTVTGSQLKQSHIIGSHGFSIPG